MLKRWVLLLSLLLSGITPPALAQTKDEPMSNLYTLITQQSGWLNTSRALTPEDLQGRIILLDFWTFCCINCIHVMPDLQYLEEKFGHDLTVIGVHSAKFKNEQDSENIRQAILRYGLHHPVVNDFDFATWKSFGVRAWPTLMLINPKGLLEATYSGEGHRAEIERDIERLRSQYAGKITTDPLPIALEQDKQPPSVLAFPSKLAYSDDFEGKRVLFVADSAHQRVVVMTLDGKIIDSIGSGATGREDGAFEQASFATPQGMAYKNRVLYIADTGNHLLRAADFASRTVSTVAGTGTQGHERAAHNRPALEVSIASPWDIAFYPDDRHLAIAMAGMHQLWSYDTQAKTLSVIAGMGNESIDDGRFPLNSLSQPSGLSAAGDKLYFVDAETSSLRVFKDGEIKTLIGTGLFDFGYKEGTRQQALMQHPLGLFAFGSEVYVADSYNHSIRHFDVAKGVLANFAGHGVRGNTDGAFAEASFNEPNDILQVGDKLYVADTNNNAIRVLDLTGRSVSTLAVTQPQSESTVEFSNDLPNTEPLEPMIVAVDTPLTLELALQPGWHINKDAPSYLALFDMAKAPKPVISFDKDALAAHRVSLPALPAGEYRAQATLYYCEDKEGAQCLIKSFDVMLNAYAGGKAAISLKLN